MSDLIEQIVSEVIGFAEQDLRTRVLETAKEAGLVNNEAYPDDAIRTAVVNCSRSLYKAFHGKSQVKRVSALADAWFYYLLAQEIAVQYPNDEYAKAIPNLGVGIAAVMATTPEVRGNAKEAMRLALTKHSLQSLGMSEDDVGKTLVNMCTLIQ